MGSIHGLIPMNLSPWAYAILGMARPGGLSHRASGHGPLGWVTVRSRLPYPCPALVLMWAPPIELVHRFSVCAKFLD